MRVNTINANHVAVSYKGQTTLFSYDTPVCTRSSTGLVILHPAWDYSRTTSKYRSQFLGESTVATRKKLMNNYYSMEEFYA